MGTTFAVEHQHLYCSVLLPQHAHLSSAEGGVEEDMGRWRWGREGRRLPVRRADKPNRLKVFWARASAWLRRGRGEGGSRFAPQPRLRWRQKFEQKEKTLWVFGAACCVGFTLKASCPPATPSLPQPPPLHPLLPNPENKRRRGKELLLSLRRWSSGSLVSLVVWM